MILARDFVFVHMPKTGGTFVRKLFRDHAPESWQVQEIHDHITAENTPESHAQLPKFGFVRNPYPWYVSWFNYHLQQLGEEKLDVKHFFARHSNQGELDLKATIFNMHQAPEVQQSGTGFFTMYLQRHFGPECRLVEVFKMETLRPDLLGFLREHARDLPAKMVAAIEGDPKVNVTSKRHYSEAYDEELRDFIWREDQHVFQRFGYTFDRGS